ncbi:MAG: amidohydrolase family protein, partial [Opitutales bacterium]|nr:amidohydrolase family protein [Opitutales bacterium]
MQDSTAAGILDIAERLNPAHPMKELRWTIAHCDLISEATIKRAQELGLTLAVHNKTAKPAVEGRDSPPVAAMQKSGIVWGLGSDGTVVATINPFHALWWVTSGKVFPNRTSIRKPVSRAAALTAHTRSNAYLMFKEKDLGSIEVGKLADMVVLDRDYLTVPVDEIRDIKPVMTIVGGRLVYLAQ